MRKSTLVGLIVAALPAAQLSGATTSALRLSPAETLEGRGVSVLVEQNHFSPIFFDEKNAGIQLILHGDRVATDGEVRLNPTPEQWDPVPAFRSRERGPQPNQLIVTSSYPAVGLNYRVVVTAEAAASGLQ